MLLWLRQLININLLQHIHFISFGCFACLSVYKSVKNKVPVSIFAIFIMGRYFAEHDCTGFFSFISVLYSKSSNVFFSYGPHRWPCSQIWKGFFGNQIQHCGWNPNCFKANTIRWLTQTDPRAGLKRSWLRVFCCRTLKTFSCDFLCVWVNRWMGQWGPLKHWSYKLCIMMLGQSWIFKMVHLKWSTSNLASPPKVL